MKSSFKTNIPPVTCTNDFNYHIPLLIVTSLLITLLSACASTITKESSHIISLPSDKQLTIRTSPNLALSPDGKLIVYPADTVNGDTRQLYLQPVYGQSGKNLEGTTGGETPFFSPDGKWIGFFADGKLKKVPIDGGEPQDICNVTSPTGGSWGKDNSIVFADGPVWQVPSSGGSPQQITQILPGEQHSWPTLLPNDKIIFNLLPNDRTTSMVVMQKIGTKNRTILLEEGNYPRYIDSGYLVFNDAGSLKAVSLDIKRNLLSGEPVIITEDVLVSVNSGASQYSISKSGDLVYLPGRIFGRSRHIVNLDRQGNERDPGLPLRRYSYVTYSPDGRYLAIEANEQILIHDIQNNSTLGVIETATFPVWGPEEDDITFSSVNNGVAGLYQVSINNLNEIELIISGEYPVNHSYSWSGDGQSFAYTEIRPDSGMDIWLRRGNLPPEPIYNSPVHECCPVFSPDGRWMAFIAGEPGKPDVYIQSLSTPETRIRVSDNGGREPVWSRSGKDLFYWQDRQLMAVEIPSDSGVKMEPPTPLFQGVFVSSTSTWRTRYDISPKDDEFVIIRRGAEEMGVTELNYIPNSTDRLGQ
jgi:Tol biopolymer transport system component